MRFYSRFVFICNTCFILAAAIWWIEQNRRQQGNFNGLIGFQPLESTLVILGYGAIFFNFIFLMIALYGFLTRKKTAVPGWIMIFNFCIFPLQVYYFFFS